MTEVATMASEKWFEKSCDRVNGDVQGYMSRNISVSKFWVVWADCGSDCRGHRWNEMTKDRHGSSVGSSIVRVSVHKAQLQHFASMIL